MTTFDWTEPLDAPDGTCFWWAVVAVPAFGEDLEVTVYYETASLENTPSRDRRLDELGVHIELAHEHLIHALRNTPESLRLTRADAELALERCESGGFADATEVVLYQDGDTLVRFPFADLPGTEEFGVGVTINSEGKLELQDLRDSIEVGEANA